MHPVLKTTPVLFLIGFSACDKAVSVRPATLVQTEIVHTESRQSVIRLTGDVQARVRTELSFRVSGRVTERLFDVGDHVNEGDVLARLDPAEQQSDLIGAKASVESAEAKLRLAIVTLDRQKMLLASGFTTRVSYDQAEEGMRTAESTLEGAKAQLSTTADALTYTELRASAAGFITSRNIEVGQVAQATQSAYSLAEDGARDAVFDVYESVFLNPAASDTIKLTLVSDLTVTAVAKVREVSPTVDAKNATVRVKFAIQHPPSAMTLGSAITGEGRTKSGEKTVLPWSALTASVNGPAVWVVDPNTSAVALRDIEIESYETNKIIVGNGLRTGDRVVSNGGKLLHPGQVVTLGEAQT